MTVSAVFSSTPAASRIAQIRSRIGADNPQNFARQLQAYTVGAGAAVPASEAGLAAGAIAQSSMTPIGGTPTTGTTPETGRSIAEQLAQLGDVRLPDSMPYASLFEQAGRAHDVPPVLLAAVARVESAFDPAAISSAGAQGLMQFMPATAAEMGVDPFDPASAIDGAARYLRRELDRFGELDLAFAAYNAGPGAVQRHGGVPPFAETQDYVRKIHLALESYA